jgi:hypothetical protein
MNRYKKPELTSEWMTATLKENGFLHNGHVENISFETRSVIGLTADFVFIEATFSENVSGDLPRHFVLKQNKADQVIPNEQKSFFRAFIESEVRFYQSFASNIDSSALIQSFGSAFNEENLNFYILLEDISNSHYQTAWPLPPSGSECEMIAESLAKIHGSWWAKDSEIEDFTGLSSIEIMEKGLKRINEIIPSFIDFLGDRISEKQKKTLEQTVNAENVFRNRLCSGGLTLVHGDSHFWNFFLPKDKKVDSIRIFDWQGFSSGFGLLNIAQFMGLHLYSDMRKRIQKRVLRAYHETLLSVGVKDYTWEDCWYDYRLSAIPQLWSPIGNWNQNVPAHIWWSKLESAFAIFDDLECQEIIDAV